MSIIREGILLGIGNPLLDIIVQGDSELLKKYGLKANDAIIADESHLPLYHEITEKYSPDYAAGGAAQNALRVCQWILKSKNSCVYMGSVGTDQYSEILKSKAIEGGVNVRYQYQTDVPTGTCACIVTYNDGSHRSLCAYLGAANSFTKDHILEPSNMALIKAADYIYIGGFFLTVSPETIMALAEISYTENKVLATNLSAPFICQYFTEPLMNLMPYVDVLFGNNTEAEALAETLKFGTKDIKEIILKIAKLTKRNESKSRLVIITQEHLPVLVAKDGIITEIPVPEVPKELIIDTNGAGDAFVGGFLSQFIQNKDVSECVRCGIWAAGHIIQNSGCHYDPELTYDC